MMILVGIGGALGAASRYLAGVWIARKTRSTFPYSTFYINIAGSFLLGIIIGLKLNQDISEWSWLLLGVGFCGAFTTFSTFGYEVIQLMITHQTRRAFVYIVATTAISIISSYIGIQVLI
ncbi:fluoride efflux transporter CrcB [Bacillus sinesaloumensis]|uniref:fluoride efflux transporter CrcB n=1 Tax=Litchfieldia sinesaloumensis TaxID=1926280 RepID=UPI0009886AE6|nr:fluoride efflux transporter CrcB [Bacillus sinesaloumensis]